jgi:hypothetical protein
MAIHLGTDLFIDEICELLERSYPGIRIQFNFTGIEKMNTTYLLHYSFPHVPLFVFSDTCPETGVIISDDLSIGALEELLGNTLQLSVNIFLHSNGYFLRNREVGLTRLERLRNYADLHASIA